MLVRKWLQENKNSAVHSMDGRIKPSNSDFQRAAQHMPEVGSVRKFSDNLSKEHIKEISLFLLMEIIEDDKERVFVLMSREEYETAKTSLAILQEKPTFS